MKEPQGTRLRAWCSPLLLCAGLGVALRLFRFALNSPLWWNEAFLAVNFLKRGYWELLEALDYHQVCPHGFLWAEKALISVAGFQEWSLRLIPLLSGIGSMAAMVWLARSTVPPRIAWVAVLILAVAYHPIRLASEVKPYSTDLAVAALVLAIAARALQVKGRDHRFLLFLILISPVCLAVSYPAVFVLGGAAAVLLFGLWAGSLRFTRACLLGFCFSLVLSFAALQMIAVAAQAKSADASGMAQFWEEGLACWDSPGTLVLWLIKVHAGPIFALPAGDGPVVSLVVLLFFIIGGTKLYHRKRFSVLALILSPFVLTLLAALLGKYPYGARARVVQHLVPSECVLLAIGGHAFFTQLVRTHSRRLRLARLFVLALVLVGTVPLIPDFFRPYRSEREWQARAFAQRFWSDLGKSPATCLRWDLAVQPWDSPNPDVALYICNQAIFSPARRASGSSQQAPANPRQTPSRFVAFVSPAVTEVDQFGSWHDKISRDHGPLKIDEYAVPGHEGRPAFVRVFTLRPEGPLLQGHSFTLPTPQEKPSGFKDSDVNQMVTSTRRSSESQSREVD